MLCRSQCSASIAHKIHKGHQEGACNDGGQADGAKDKVGASAIYGQHLFFEVVHLLADALDGSEGLVSYRHL